MSTPSATRLDTVEVPLGTQGYEIRIGTGLIATLGEQIGDLLARPRVAIVSDETVAAQYLEAARAGLAAAGIAGDAILIPAGERAKSFATLETVSGRLLDLGLERQDMVLALGGGVVGDLAGFAAAILRRGVGVIQVPTTLLAQVDSAVGGKTGINMPQGKNLIGAFHQPRRVIVDLDTLATLPLRQRRAGYAEIVKYGLIDRPDFFCWLEENGPAVLAGDPAALARAVGESCRAKAAVVAADAEEAGQRALLNLGHSFGHALEAALGYDGRLLHGEAVAIGMVLACALSTRLGHAAAEDGARLTAHLAAVGLPTSIAALDAALTPDRLIELMRQDKKMRDGRLTFVLLRGIGDAFLSDDVPDEAVRAVLETDCA